MVAREQLYTADELLMLPRDGKHYELLEGQLIEMTPSGFPHGLLTAKFAQVMLNYIELHQIGSVFGAETGFRLTKDPDTVLGIDAAFISKERLQLDQQGYIDGAPDLAVEIVSPSNTKTEMHDKVRLYFQNGARLVWVVYPKARAIYVYRSAHEVTILEEADMLTGGDVLPEFSISIRELFSVLDNK